MHGSNVSVALYFESHCEPCQQFATGPLTEMLALPTIRPLIDLKLVPFGNAHEYPDKSFTCQHGADECATNLLELCVLRNAAGGDTAAMFSPAATAASWPFIHCMELAHGDSSHGRGCAASSGVNWSAIMTCNDSAAVAYF